MATLAGLLPDLKKAGSLGLKVIGTLDIDSEGLVLLTSDGELASVLDRASSQLTMTYHLKIQGGVNDDDLGKLLAGWRFVDERQQDKARTRGRALGRKVRPTSVEAIATTGRNTWLEVVVPEIRARAIWSAAEALGRRIQKLSRVSFGGISFEGMGGGDFRDLTASEISALRKGAVAKGAGPNQGESNKLTKSGPRPTVSRKAAPKQPAPAKAAPKKAASGGPRAGLKAGTKTSDGGTTRKKSTSPSPSVSRTKGASKRPARGAGKGPAKSLDRSRTQTRGADDVNRSKPDEFRSSSRSSSRASSTSKPKRSAAATSHRVLKSKAPKASGSGPGKGAATSGKSSSGSFGRAAGKTSGKGSPKTAGPKNVGRPARSSAPRSGASRPAKAGASSSSKAGPSRLERVPPRGVESPLARPKTSVDNPPGRRRLSEHWMLGCRGLLTPTC